mmetsp:Transcript_54241/g.155930  ORF Transcript_54241/g.155930 Transcript_54241/m.155930 type:complete len:335 (-) Transcript_54241:80-1084(-)
MGNVCGYLRSRFRMRHDGSGDSDSEASSAGVMDSEHEASRGLAGFQPDFVGRVENRRREQLALYSWGPSGTERGIAVLFHGYGSSARFPTCCWLAEALVRIGVRCYGADMVGHGESEGTSGLLPSVQGLAEDGLDVVRHVRALHLNSPIFLCGTSMGGAIALSVGLLADFPLGGAVLLSPMVKQNKANLPHPAVIAVLRGLSMVVPSLAVIKSNASQADLQYTDPVRREQCARAPQYEGKMRLGTAATLLGMTEVLEQRFEEITFPFWVAVGGREVVVDPDGPEELFHRAGTEREDKVFKKYPTAQHALLAEPSPLREEIEEDICAWLSGRLPP